ncbi:AmmeMemoRadiSam system protein B [Anaeromyxobacter paludicola]|uniref:AmmeMemoRadiSam system protein B n=1 Tax=Anaeromyxobacter paludicola TaxID=2918171 RepID=A0ABM7XA00_9BACT|nr:AmmeMemoRadiSam system protein B [Anaeromyxobacter paludicola]BDG08677.1 hypothetical protein AMPC_17900 [Anaeromyxobacter paludicola]
MDLDPRPRLVPLEPRLVQLEDGTQGVVLRDPTGVLTQSALVSPGAYLVLAHLDGTRTLPEVERALALQGRPVPLPDIVTLVRRLEESGLVHGPAHEALRRRALEAFRALPARPASCAGGAYPEEPEALRAFLDGFLSEAADPPGRPSPALPARRGGSAPEAPPESISQRAPRSTLSRDAGEGRGGGGPANGDVRLLVAPHIDLHRGGAAYGHAYRALAASDAELFVVFGTAHATPPHLFTLTRLDYDTPLGPVPTDRELAGALAEELGEEELFADELCHRQEHSCEFQLLWLRHLFPDRPIRALPVLCSSISHLDDPDGETRAFLDALARAVRGRRVCYVAGADLAHVGPMYGDEAAPTPEALAGLAAEDRRTLAFLERGDPGGFHRDATLDDARRRLCGVAPIYAAMRAAGAGARLIHYGQWSDGTDSVSFAAAAG